MPRPARSLAELEELHDSATCRVRRYHLRTQARARAAELGVPCPPFAFVLAPKKPDRAARERARREQVRAAREQALRPIGGTPVALPAEIQLWIARHSKAAVSLSARGVELHDGRGVVRLFPTMTAAIAAVA